ncbi:hypothetical protein FSP39_016493 [Pinctada imbricata]|uniref:CLIC N-terminal domain-containing protein n=1 Tax=Pinctada imbricata TaxID=66713 RepID=A0AA88YJN2_PINIB|nr:hypothetical protein FSP39_016493 [Pinctada imbricata]
MSEEQKPEQADDIKEEDKAKFELYIKASLIDGGKKGSCPICQQWFMIAFLLAEEDDCAFKVFTVQANTPPQSYTKMTLSKTFPVVLGLGGKNNDGADITDMVYDSFDEVEQFFESVNKTCPKLKRTQQVNALPLKVFADLYKDFKLFLQNEYSDGKKLLQDLEKINDFLEEQEQPFLTGPSLTYADCSLLPKLQHIRIAGKHYRNFDIPREMQFIWRYLDNGYNSEAFSFTMPTDQDIVQQYEQIAVKGKSVKGRPTLQKQTITCTVPDGYLTVNGEQNGDQQEAEQQQQEELEQRNEQQEVEEQEVEEQEVQEQEVEEQEAEEQEAEEQQQNGEQQDKEQQEQQNGEQEEQHEQQETEQQETEQQETEQHETEQQEAEQQDEQEAKQQEDGVETK